MVNAHHQHDVDCTVEPPPAIIAAKQPQLSGRIPQRSRYQRVMPWALLMLAALTGVGCEGVEIIRLQDLMPVQPDTTHLHEAEYRERYQATQDSEALKWLMAHRVKTGMTRSEVESVIGQTSRYEPYDRKYKSHNSAFQVGDKMYAFGPDNRGQTYYLVFRENKLVGYDGKQFLDDKPDTAFEDVDIEE